MSRTLFTLSTLMLAGSVSAAANAQPGPTPTMLKTFGVWGVYSYASGGRSSCYVLSSPQQAQPTNVDHGNNYFLVARDPDGKGFYPQAVLGYDARPQSEMSVSIDGKVFAMMPKGNSGWTRNASDDAGLIDAMKGGRTISLNAVSQRGTQTRYTYSLSGISAALDQASRCK